MAQVSYGTITITDITDIDNIQNYYLATSASSGVTTSTSGWTTGIQSMTSTNQYLWNYEQILGTGGVVINTTTPVIIGRYGQNGQPGVSITSIDEYYKANNSSTTKPTSWNAVNVIDKPTASNKYLWNYQVIHYSNNTTEGSASEARIIGVYGDKGEKGDNGISPTVSKSGGTVTITDAEGNTVTVSDGTNGTSYYTHIRYATSSAGANMTSTPTSSTIYIGIYSGTSATAPTTANSYTWSKYMGTDGTNGISVTKVTPIYYLKTSSGSAPTAPNSGTAITSTSTGTGVWTTAVPTYVNGGTYYTSTQTYLSGGTSPVSSTAVIDQALTTANSNAYGAYNVATGINQHFWSIESDYATGIPAGSYITDTIIDTFKSNKTGGNLLTRSDGIWIRNGIQTLASLTGTALQFYNPSDSNHPLQLSIGANGTLQSGNYTRGSDSKFSSNGTKIDLVNGDIITKYFRISQGLETGLNAGAYIHGTVEALDGRIGEDSTNYWEISKFTDYNLNSNATIIGHGGSFIQLGDSSTWRLATNRIHTGWYSSGDTVLHYPEINSKYWDFGIHAPTAATEKLLYIRKSKANTSASNVLTNLLYDIDDSYATPQWDYMFYISANGSLYAKNLYVLDDNGNPIQIGGTDGVYLLKTGGTITGNLTVNGTITGNLTGTASNAAKVNNLTVQTEVPANAVFTDKYVRSTQNNTTKIWLVGTPDGGDRTGEVNYDSNVYLTTTAGTLHATTFEGNLSGTATKANQDGDGNVIKTTYLKLSGGNVTGPVTFGSSVAADELTVGDLVVNGSGSFTNGLYGDLIGNATSASKLGSSTIGAADRPIYLNAGTATQTTYRMASTNATATTARAITDILETGIWYVNGTNSTDLYSIADGAAYVNKYDNNWIAEIYQDYRTGQIALRGKNNGTWQAWRKVLDSSNYNTWVPKLDGTGATGTWAINISGNAVKDGSGNTIASYYAPKSTAVTNVAYDSTNKKLTKTINGTTSDIVAVSTLKTAMELNNVTNNAQVKKISSSTSGNFVVWNATTGDTVADSGIAKTNVITNVQISGSKLTLTYGGRASGSQTVETDVTIVASQASGATILTNASGQGLTVGDASYPVYFSSGVPTKGNVIPTITLNGSATTSPSFYAPTGGGTANQVLISKGNAAPEWTNQSNLGVGTATKATQDGDGNTITTSYLRRFAWWGSKESHDADDLHGGTTFAYSTHNAPTTGTIVAFDCSTNTNYTLQLMGAYSNLVNNLYYRNRNGDNGTWGDWRQVVYNSGSWGISITGNAATATTATTATNVAWSGITNNPITFNAAAYGTTGWSQLGGRTNPLSSIRVWKPTDIVTWGTQAHSAVIAYGCGDTKGMIDIAYNSPLISFAGGNAGGSTDATPKWYFKLSATSGATYTFPSSSKTLAATDGTGASGTWGISISGNAATASSATKATQDASGNTITSTYVKKAGDTMTGALNTANGIANKIGDDSQLGDFNVGGTLGIQGLNNTTGIGLLQQGTTWGSSANFAHITYDGTYVKMNKLLQITTNSNTVTIGSQNTNFTHIYNSANIPFIFSHSVLTTSGDLGNNSYPFTNVNIKGAYNMLVGSTQKAAMHYDSTLEAIVFSFA